jgi:FkbM family methyltransferase
MGARRELLNDPAVNGEYALQQWVADALQKSNSASQYHFLDVGANLGCWSEQLAKTLSENTLIDKSTIHGFEPAPDQGDSFLAKFPELAAQNRVRLERKAVGTEEGTVTFVVSGPQSGNNAIRTTTDNLAGRELEVPVTTIDKYANEHGIESVALLKIDTEGNDFNVIRGAKDLFRDGRISVLQFEYNWRWIDFGHWLKSVFVFAKECNYAVGLLTPDRIEICDEWHPEMDRYIEANYVMVNRDILAKIPHAIVDYSDSNFPSSKH